MDIVELRIYGDRITYHDLVMLWTGSTRLCGKTRVSPMNLSTCRIT